MDRNLRMTLAYDGSQFHGWQRQADVRTVQEEVEKVLMRLLRQPVSVQGASRTDAGVHARGQVANFRYGGSIPLDRLRRALADRLPPDVAVVRLAEAAPDFDARRGALGKLYRYRVLPGRRSAAGVDSPAHLWAARFPMDPDRMAEAAALLVGRHDFAGFASQGSPRATTIRSVYRCDIRCVYEEIRIDVSGDGFLYNQVRNMVGTLTEIGRGHWPVQRVAEVLAARDRRLAGPTAPPGGLSLEWVRYPPPGPPTVDAALPQADAPPATEGAP